MITIFGLRICTLRDISSVYDSGVHYALDNRDEFAKEFVEWVATKWDIMLPILPGDEIKFIRPYEYVNVEGLLKQFIDYRQSSEYMQVLRHAEKTEK